MIGRKEWRDRKNANQNVVNDLPSFIQIADALISGFYVTYEHAWSRGVVVGAWKDSRGQAWLLMWSFPCEYPPFKSGYEQANANGYVFTVRGSKADDFAM